MSLKPGGSMWVAGLASRTDSDAHNLALSRRRVDAVIQFLRKESPNNFRTAVELPVGERAAKLAGVPDNTEDEYWRAVVISVWSFPSPPPAVIPRPLPPHERALALVPRMVSAEFLAQVNYGGAWGEDSPSAEGFNATATDYANKVLNKKTDFRNITMKIMPATAGLKSIWTLRDTTGSTDFRITSVDLVTCKLLYHWGNRNGPCILVHGFWRRGSLKNEEDDYYRLTNEQENLWITNPYHALASLQWSDRDYERVTPADQTDL
jgi:hypothetical protein